MSNLSELLPAGAGAKSAEFVASGTLATGTTVALQSDGTVKAIASNANSFPQTLGTPTVFETGASSYTSTTFDSSSNKIVVAFRDGGNSNYGTAVVGTVSGTSISFGSPVVFESASVTFISATFDSASNKVVIEYTDNGNSNYGTAIVGTVSGTSISFGSAVVYESAASYDHSATFDSSANKIVIAYRDNGNSNYGTAIVGTVSGTSISFGSPVVYESAASFSNKITFDSNSNKVVIAYIDDGNSSYGTAIVGTVSGTSISFGSAVVFQSSFSGDTSIAFDSNSSQVIIFNSDGSGYGKAIVGAVSGTSISFGSAVTVNSALTLYMSVTFDPNADRAILAYRDSGSSNYGRLRVATISGTSISFVGSTVTFEAATTNYISSTFDSTNNEIVLAYSDGGNASRGTSVVFQNASTSSNSADFIGITDQAIADTATGAVIVQGGVSEKLSGLTVGADYYVQADGSLSGAGGIPYDIVSASLSTSFSISAQQTLPTGLTFSADGTKMFTCGELNSDVDEYTLSTAYDVSTASYSQNFSIAGQETEPTGLAFNTDGTKMFVLGNAGNDVNEYALSTGFDVSTASFSQAFSISAQEATPHGIAFNTDGTKMFIVGRAGVDVNEYVLSTGFDVSTASYSQNFSVSSQEADPLGIAFNSDGTKMFITGDSNDAVFQYNLSTGFDVSTASYASITFSVLSQDTNPNDIAFSSDGTKMFIIGATGDSVYQYATTPSSTTVPAGKALSTTSLLLNG